MYTALYRPTQRISIHMYNGTSIFDFWRPNLLGNNGGGSGLVLGGTFRDANTGLVIKYKTSNATHGTVRERQTATHLSKIQLLHHPHGQLHID